MVSTVRGREMDFALLAALVAAHACGDRPYLYIKGLSSSIHGLRHERVSADADVLVNPASEQGVVIALQQVGWMPRTSSRAGHELVTHSTSFVHPQWPVDIDLHREFPGLLAQPEDVFKALFNRRIHIEVAGNRLTIPDRAGATLIQVAHSLRTLSQNPRHREEYLYLIDFVVPSLSRAQRADVVSLAAQIGALDTLRPFLEKLGVPLPDPTPPGVNPALDEWRARVAADGVVGAQALIAARRLAWYKRPAAMWHIIWPSERDFRIDHPEVAPGRGPLLRARFARFGRGLRQIPAILRGRRQARRGITETSLLDGEK